jgi:integrase
MTRIRLKFVQAWVDRQGRVHRYFRRPGYPRVRLPGLPGSAEFMRAYESAMDAPQIEIGAAKRSKPGSVSMAIAAYYGANEFTSLAAGTQRARRSILERFRSAHGDKPIALLPPKFITLTLSQMRPSVARNWFKAVRALMLFAISLEMRADDPTRGLRLPRVKSDGVHTWSEGEIEQFEGHYAVGTKARLALALLLYTAQRRSDIIRMGRQHIRDGVLTVRQDKTRALRGRSGADGAQCYGARWRLTEAEWPGGRNGNTWMLPTKDYLKWSGVRFKDQQGAVKREQNRKQNPGPQTRARVARKLGPCRSTRVARKLGPYLDKPLGWCVGGGLLRERRERTL